jgi:hypothetical protein
MSRVVTPLVILAGGVVVCLLLWYWPHVRDEFFVLAGSRNETGGWYGFHSGIGGAAYIAVFPAMILFYWHHTCHVARCLRPGRHRVDGTPWCNRHHIGARQKLAVTGSAHDLGRQL